jgi:hypothetical protein
MMRTEEMICLMSIPIPTSRDSGAEVVPIAVPRWHSSVGFCLPRRLRCSASVQQSNGIDPSSVLPSTVREGGKREEKQC